MASCDFFSYEWEETNGTRHHECYLKQGFSYNECPHPVIEQYVPWSNPDDPGWHGVSGSPRQPDCAPFHASPQRRTSTVDWSTRQ